MIVSSSSNIASFNVFFFIGFFFFYFSSRALSSAEFFYLYGFESNSCVESFAKGSNLAFDETIFDVGILPTDLLPWTYLILIILS